jgi:hypothetical protein
MWRELMGLALFTALNPMLLGLILLVISRPRPVQNLIAFWIGAVVVNVPIFLGSLFALQSLPSFASFAKQLATPDPNTSVKPLQLGTGIFALLVAALIAARMRTRRRAAVPAGGAPGGGNSVLVLDTDPAGDSPRRGAVWTAVTNVGSRFQQWFRRLHDEWENGALWVALVFGLLYMPPPPLLLLVDTIIVASGATVGAQVVLVIAFVIVMLAVFEVVLVSYVVAPARTKAVLEPVHNWAHAHRLLVLLVLFAAVGIWQVVTGVGIA